MAIKTFVKKGRVLISVVSRKNFKFSDKNKKGKDKCICRTRHRGNPKNNHKLRKKNRFLASCSFKGNVFV
jgi:hypothetical protein